jgi:hypothetical protein
MIARVNEDLEAIHRWSIENGLLLNPAKSQAILVSNSPSELPLPLPLVIKESCSVAKFEGALLSRLKTV